jgi:hypothetical protein
MAGEEAGGAGGARVASSPRGGGPVSFAAEVTVVEYLLSREEREDKQAAFRQISRRKQLIKRQRAASPEFDLAQALRERPSAARRPRSARLEEGFRRLLSVAAALGASEPEGAEAGTPATPMLHFYRSPAGARCEAPAGPAAAAAPAPQLPAPCEEEDEAEGSEACFDPADDAPDALGALGALDAISQSSAGAASPAGLPAALPAAREPLRCGQYSPPPLLSLRPRSQLRRRLWQGEPQAQAAKQEPEACAARVGLADGSAQELELEAREPQPLDLADGSPLELEFETREPQPLEHLLFPHPPHQPALHPLFAAMPPAAPAAFLSIRSERLGGAPDDAETGAAAEGPADAGADADADADADAPSSPRQPRAESGPRPQSPPPPSPQREHERALPSEEAAPSPAARKSRASPKASSVGAPLAVSIRSRAKITSWELVTMTFLFIKLISALLFSMLDRTANAAEHVKKSPAIAYA